MTVWWGRDSLRRKRVILHESISGRIPEPFDDCHVPQPYRLAARSPRLPVDLVTCTAVDDPGVMLDSTIVEGQVQGSIANGLGQALTEDAVYDAQSGQLVSGSFMDYGMPRAHHMPVELREAVHPVPATSNPLGVKGTGEAGTTAAIAAVMNAISNAVPNGAADHMEMPATPAKVWAACQRGSEAE